MCDDQHAAGSPAAAESSLSRRGFLQRVGRCGRRGRRAAAVPPAAAAFPGQGGLGRRPVRLLDGHARAFLVQRAGRLDGQPAFPGDQELGGRAVVDRPRHPDGRYWLPPGGAFHQPHPGEGRPGPGPRLGLDQGHLRPAGQPVHRWHRAEPVLAQRPGGRRKLAPDRQEHHGRRGGVRLLRADPPGQLELPRQPQRPEPDHRRPADQRLDGRLPGTADRQLLPRGDRRPPGRRLPALLPVRSARRHGAADRQRDKRDRHDPGHAGQRQRSLGHGHHQPGRGHRRPVAGHGLPRLRPVRADPGRGQHR